MNTRSITFLAAICGACLLFWLVLRLGPAHSEASALLEREQQMERDLARLTALQGSQTRLADARMPNHDLITRIQESMTLAGLPHGTFQGVQPLGEQVDPTATLRTRRLQVRFGGLNARQTGAWIAAWRSPDQPWLIEGIDMVHQDVGNADGAFAVAIVLVARSMEQTP